jgi:DNA-binding beta-propeller fold protein YncE
MYHRVLLVVLGLLAGIAAVGLVLSQPAVADEAPYEVWALDQADTRPDGGGTLYIYEGSKLSGRARPTAEVVDLGEAARERCLADTGTAPRRPHMLAFNPTQSHAIISFVATGHVLFMDAAHRTPLTCIDVGAQAHAAFASPDERYVIVANQNGKLLQRIGTEYSTNTFHLEDEATIDLAAGTTPSGALRQDPSLRPDNAPICPIIDSISHFTFVTLRGGGLFVVDSTATPMAIVGEYDRDTVHPNGCGGVEARGKVYLNSGGGTLGNPLESDLYAFPLDDFSSSPNPPNTPTPRLVFSHDDRGFVDSHGAVLTRQHGYLWVADRAANRVIVVDTAVDQVVNEVDLSGAVSRDPAPDLLAISPAGHRVFMTLRGPNPLTANVTGVDNAVGSTPGVGIVRVEQGGRTGVLHAVAPISKVVEGVERADPHGIGVRRK